MNIAHTVHKNTSILALSGRLDATTCATFEENCRQELAGKVTSVIVNLNDMEYISSAGLRSILGMEKLARQLDKKLVFCSMQSMVSDIFRVVGFDRILHIVATQENALAALENN